MLDIVNGTFFYHSRYYCQFEPVMNYIVDNLYLRISKRFTIFAKDIRIPRYLSRHINQMITEVIKTFLIKTYCVPGYEVNCNQKSLTTVSPLFINVSNTWAKTYVPGNFSTLKLNEIWACILFSIFNWTLPSGNAVKI